LVWLLYQVTPDRWRWLLLLLASLGFYASLKSVVLIGVLTCVTVWSYYWGLKIHALADGDARQRCFNFAVGGNVLLLAGLKFLPALSGGVLLLVTIGVSYFIFQAISYLADIHLDMIEPETHFGRYFLSLAFFPKLLQGPIERSGELLPQLQTPYNFEYNNMRYGLLLFGWGLFKKIVLADRLGLYVDAVYGNVHGFSGLTLLLATYGYAFQIYFDFSGYTDMALGTALLFNIKLTQNFNAPYLATSVADFWRRWHISFSRWILDYIFKPLQMAWRNDGVRGTALALMIAFLISGLWHGVRWGFLIWGGLHGLYLASSVFYRPYQKKIYKTLGIDKTKLLTIWQVVVTFNLVSFAWIFFRANNLTDAWYVINQLGRAMTDLVHIEAVKTSLTTGLSLASLKALVLGVLVYSSVEMTRHRVSFFSFPLWVRWSCYLLLGMSLTILSASAQYRFVYYQF
jgi:D-alanyl-lipoteichoic acid acyltransferase DltB (MBOAT superfamily)